jgi:selenocysteine lyase/cysteine desulfurase
MRHDIAASILSREAGIAVRSGCFCAQPYIQKLLKVTPEQIEAFMKDSCIPRPGAVRISFGLYNTFSEIDILDAVIRFIIDNKKAYIEKYTILSNINNIAN